MSGNDNMKREQETIFPNSRFECDCGRIHTCRIDRVEIGSGVLKSLGELIRGYSDVLLVCDLNTYAVAGNRVKEILGTKVHRLLTYGDDLLIPNENAISRFEECIDAEIDLIIGVGSGVINDLCKYVSYSHSLPYFIVATAPSMDGYASKGSALILGGMKVTLSADVPRAIIADTDVLCEAPIDMIKAGYGDIIGKFSCLNDWRLSSAVTGEEICEYIYDLTYSSALSISKMGKKILSRDKDSIGELMRALVTVGIAMAYMGNSRPASGSEHHLSHFFEVTGLLRNESYFPHGIDVAYSTYLTATLREELLAIEAPSAVDFNEDLWESEIGRVYFWGGSTEVSSGIIELQKKVGLIYSDRYPVYREKWDVIRSILKSAPSPMEVLNMLSDIELNLDDFKRAYSSDKISDAVRYAKDLKDRYTVLWLYNELTR